MEGMLWKEPEKYLDTGGEPLKNLPKKQINKREKLMKVNKKNGFTSPEVYFT